MTANDGVRTSAGGLKPAQVAEFLRTHRDFFNEHVELLRTLEIPHDRGNAVSLWERQISALREENERLKIKFNEFIGSARENEALIGRIHRLILALMEAAGPRAILDLLTQRLADDFKATRVTALIFAEPSSADAALLSEFIGRGAARRSPFTDMLSAREPRCGRLTPVQTRALFDGADFKGSHVVLPLTGLDWDGLVAVSSDDTGRFDANLGTEFLTFLRDVVVLVVAPWIAKQKPA